VTTRRSSRAMAHRGPSMTAGRRCVTPPTPSLAS
jgi:hypothetical protein